MRILVSVEATPHAGEPFTEQDLAEAVDAACHEVFPFDGGTPVVPTVAQVVNVHLSGVDVLTRERRDELIVAIMDEAAGDNGDPERVSFALEVANMVDGVVLPDGDFEGDGVTLKERVLVALVYYGV